MPSSVEPVPGDWLEVELEADPALASELDVLLTRRDLGGWVVESEEPTLKWVFYVPCESGWQERLGSLGVSLREAEARMVVRRSVADEDWAPVSAVARAAEPVATLLAPPAAVVAPAANSVWAQSPE